MTISTNFCCFKQHVKPRGGLPIKSDGGGRMLRVPNFLKNYTAGCASFIEKGLHSKITETACVSMLFLKINYNLGSAF